MDALMGGMKSDSNLLKHEIAYCLGQMMDPYAIPFLTAILEKKEENAMVRHEAGEALGAIGSSASLDVLKRYRDDSTEPQEVRETCELAVARIEFLQGKNPNDLRSAKFYSIDPAPAVSSSDVSTLRAQLLDTSRSLFERYRAMFALRDIGSSEAVLALAEGLNDKSALFRHEIGYVFGQLQHPAAVDALVTTLARPGEHEMVRHEAAEALGSIAAEQCLPVLKQYINDKERVVSESCHVALDMYEYETSGSFQYANTLSSTAKSE